MDKLTIFLKQEQPKKILDVGTGGGNFIARLISVYTDFTEIIGIDTSERAIAAAKKGFEKVEKVDFQVMDGNEMSFEDGTFDMVILSNSIHHLDDMNRLFKEMERVTKKGGILLFSEMVSNDLTNEQHSHLLLHHFAAKLDRLRGMTHNDTLSENEIEDILNQHSSFNLDQSWMHYYEKAKTHFPDDIKELTSIVDRLTTNVTDEEILNEAKEIKEYITNNGFDTCPAKVVVMRNEIT